MSPFRLAVWTSIGVNYSTYNAQTEPTDIRIKFSKGASSVAEQHKDDVGLLDPSGNSEGYLVQAGSEAGSSS